MKTDSRDGLDLRLVHALQLDGRAPFSRIADVLGVSDQTIARRYTRLRTSGAIKVLGLTDPGVLGETVWLVRVQCTPDAATPVAEALARRADTSWVSMLSGGTEIAAVTRVASDRDSEALLLEKLPRTPQVTGVAAHCLIHEYFGGAQGLVNKSESLTPDQVERLTAYEPAADRGTGPAPSLSAADERLCAALARDGRAPLAELSTVTGWSQSTVRRRLAELRSQGALFFDVDYAPRTFGHGTHVTLMLSVSPAALHETGEALARHPEIAFACAITGPYNLMAVAICADVKALYTYLTSSIASLSAVQRMETSPVIRQVKAAGPYFAAPRRRGRP
ncbi:Lrp/AsnC family transcriptional regulator [Streptomyces varsoviensis]|uniref:Lrp/AsnC family transcriptional regulator n=1 Tax=Streptomyces varsoviensis TaxID=67373 RepID=UPI0004C65DDC|nr:Lrp/AsnC family transcriptional regulator [Streptomyces varsoviensis]